MCVTVLQVCVCVTVLQVCVAVLQSTVDKLLKKANLSLVVGTSSWREQFIDAITVSSGRYSHPLLSSPVCVAGAKGATCATGATGTKGAGGAGG